jgi:putative endonuclease
MARKPRLPTKVLRSGIPGDPRRGQLARRRGRLAEALAVWRLRCAGYHILARNWRHPLGEIDIAARKGRILAIVEVKSRTELAGALYALGSRQQNRLVRAALAFQLQRPDCAGLTLRFDVMAIAGGWPRHIREAWRPVGE